MRSAAAWVATGVAITTCFAPSCSAAFPAASTLHGYVTWPSMITAIRPASFFTGRSVRYRIRSWLTRARDSSMALASLSISAPLGWKSGSISDGADSAMAPIGARLDPSLMNAATSTSNWAPIALAALAAISTPSGVMPSSRQPRYPRPASCWPNRAPAAERVGYRAAGFGAVALALCTAKDNAVRSPLRSVPGYLLRAISQDDSRGEEHPVRHPQPNPQHLPAPHPGRHDPSRRTPPDQ